MIKKVLFLGLFIAILVSLYGFFSFRSMNVILITIDTLRHDYLSCYSREAPSTPVVDSIAREGVLFTNAHTQIPITLPAHSSIFTSLPPHELSVFNNGDILNDKVPVLAEILAKEGYQTAGFVSLAVLKRIFGISRGFQFYDDKFGDSQWYRPASDINKTALPWIEQHHKERFFAWIHYSDPHEPYITMDAQPDTEIEMNGTPLKPICIGRKQKEVFKFTAQPGLNELNFRAIRIEKGPTAARVVHKLSVLPASNFEMEFVEGWSDRVRPNGVPEKYFTEHAVIKILNRSDHPVPARLTFKGDIDQSLDVIRNNYSAEVQYTDRHLGELWQLLEKLDIKKKTIVIITADHGEGLGTHVRIGHLYPLYRELTQVPLIVYYPRFGRSGTKSSRLVNHLDIMPTVLSLLRVKTNIPMHGNSFLQEISWSPLDKIGSEGRKHSFVSTYTPQGKFNSFAVIHDNLKLIEIHQQNGVKWEAFDHTNDPGEFNNLARNPEQFESLNFAALRPILEEYGKEAEKAHSNRKNPEISEEEKRMLRDLGYISP
jgi:arylsulfatase A-like enzyme